MADPASVLMAMHEPMPDPHHTVMAVPGPVVETASVGLSAEYSAVQVRDFGSALSRGRVASSEARAVHEAAS